MDEVLGMRADVVGGNDLMPTLGISTSTGIIKGAAKLSALEADKLTVEDSKQSGLDFSGDFSTSVWIKSTGYGSGDGQILFSKWQHTINNQYHVYISNTDIALLIAGECTDYAYIGKSWPHTISANQWHHLIFVYNATQGSAEVYADGVSLGVLSGFPTSVADCSAEFTVGARQDSLSKSYYFDGLIDELGIWNRVLTPEEVARLYNNGVGIPYAATTTPPVLTHATSSVAFLPGIMGSRLYEADPTHLSDEENQLWETFLQNDLRELNVLPNGTSDSASVYTRDIVDHFVKLTNNLRFVGIYGDFSTYMDGLVAQQAIPAWEPLPYDWRVAMLELYNNGRSTVDSHGRQNISYAFASSTPYLKQELNRLADNSPTHKVTIVAHSMGGLVAKYLLAKLEADHDPLFQKIDKVVLVDSPQLGTPEAIAALMHGTSPTNPKTTRELAETMPTVHELLPSKEYFRHTNARPLITFDGSLAKGLLPYSALASTTVVTYDGLTRYMTGMAGLWNDPGANDDATPNVLSSDLISYADDIHTMLDTWTPPAGIEVVQIASIGVDTISGIRYFNCRAKGCFFGRDTLRHEYDMSVLGDGTVMKGSQAAGNVPTYYLNLLEYNQVHHTNYVHKDILSVGVVQDLLVYNILSDESYTPPYMTKEEPTIGGRRFRARVFSPVDLHLYQDGKHTGITGPEVVGQLGRPYEEQVPNSYYKEWGDVKYVGVDAEEGPVTLSLKGTGTGTFRLEIDEVTGDAVSQTYAFANVPVGPAASGTIMLTTSGTPVLVYDLDGDGRVDARIVPGGNAGVASSSLYFSALRQAVRTSHMSSLLKVWINARVVLAEAEVKKGKKGNLVAAQAILKTIQFTLEQQTPKNISKSESDRLSELLQALMASVGTKQ
jgi:pimeloyl-ACP methyl ester carboxylesterase